MSLLPFDDINYLNIFPHVGKAASLEIINVETAGGRLLAGNYTFAVRYLDEFSTPTNFFATSQQVAIPATPPGSSISRFAGAPGETQTTRSIRYAVHNIDMSYDRLQVAVIPQYNGVPGTPVLIPPQPILSSTMFFAYTGTEQITESSLDEILINTASYRTARTMTELGGSLYMGNLTRHEPLNFQKYANNIQVKVVLEEIPSAFLNTASFARSLATGENKPFAPEETTYRTRGFKRGDVYALYVSFILNDGHETPAYHIPGREATTFMYKGETYQEDALVPESEETLRNIAAQGQLSAESETNARWFQFISAPHPELNTGFWQNRDEQYPLSTDWEVWDVDENGDPFFTGETLARENVRHHSIPDNEYLPFKVEGEYTIRIAGLKLENVKLPSDIRDRVKGMKVYYAKRPLESQKIVDQSYALSTQQNDTFPVTISGNPTNKDVDGSEVSNSVSTYAPFNTLRTKQSIQGITHLRAVALNPDVGDHSFTAIFGGGDNQKTVSEEAIANMDFQGYNNDLRFRRVIAISYVPSYTFQFDEDVVLANSLVRLSDGLFPFDFDNTNGEEKIAIYSETIGFGYTDFPEVLYELSQYKENMYLGFDLQELQYTGFQAINMDKFDPVAVYGTDESPSPSPDPSPAPLIEDAFSTEVIFGGDTFIGIWASRHTRWRDRDSDLLEQYVRHSLVESYAHPELRSPGEFVWEQWAPGTSSVRDYATILWRDGSPVYKAREGELFPDNVIHYNQDYLMNETYKPTTPFPKRRSNVLNLPTRIIRSRQEDLTADIDLFRQFREEDFVDLPTNRGVLVKLANVNNLLMPHMEKAVFRTRGKEELATTDFRAFIGSGDIFAIKPEELYETDIGYGGIHALRAGVVTEYGYMFVDQWDRKIFHLTREGLKVVSSDGMERFFEERLEYNFETFGLEANRPISKYFGIQVSWDPVYRRYMVTKKDRAFVDPVLGSTLEFDEVTQRFKEPGNPDGYLDWSDETYFKDDSFTVTYSPQIGQWISFHDYYADFYFYNSDELFSAYNSVLFRHNQELERGRFYGTKFPSVLEYIDNREAKMSKTVAALFVETELFSPTGRPIRDKTVTEVRIRNSYQDTGNIAIAPFIEQGGLARQAQGFWRINQIRNKADIDGNIQEDLQWHQKEWLSDRYHYIKLSYDNLDDNLLYIVSSELNIKKSLR